MMMSENNWSNLLNEAITKPGLLLAAYSYFHNYSCGNQVLAITQCNQRGIEPGSINTYPGWQRIGRQVRKGERALMLCMPITYKDRSDPEATRTGFVYKPRWFVLSQTEGDAVEPELAPTWTKELALSTLSITEIQFDIMDGNTQGFARSRSIAINPLAVMPHKTTFHELAHVVLGHTAEADFSDADSLPRDLREVEAECVALICCESFRTLRSGVFTRLHSELACRS
jgi:hypothetical protein